MTQNLTSAFRKILKYFKYTDRGIVGVYSCEFLGFTVSEELKVTWIRACYEDFTRKRVLSHQQACAIGRQVKVRLSS